jgi:O-Antigen ligase
MMASSTRSLSDNYILLLGGVLAGYALVGKGFAYLGFPPLFVGEIAFAAGLAVLLRTGCLLASLTMLPNLLLMAIMAWVLARTLPFISEFGSDALRDSVTIFYGGFAFIVVALVLEDVRRVGTILRYYNKFLNLFIPIAPVSFFISRYLFKYIPTFTAYNVPLLQVRPGEVAVHLAGAAVFILVGFRKVSALYFTLMLVTAIMVVSQNRGAMIAIILPIAIAMLATGRARQLMIAIVVGGLAFAMALALETSFGGAYREPKSSDERSVSAQQIVNNAASIIGQSGVQVESTKTWREDWWSGIVKDTVNGPYFWLGRGFGVNLAVIVGNEAAKPVGGEPALRSPHNVHMTMLARGGVPGAILWELFLACWFGMIIRAWRLARGEGQREWAGLFIFVGCYVMSILIDASFDVALEGPMVGIWFWCLIGLGAGAVMAHRFEFEECRRSNAPSAE